MVAKALLGPSVRTMQRHRASMFQYGLGLEERHVQNAVRLLAQYGCQGSICAIAVDASASQARQEALIENGSVMVYGLNGGAAEVRSSNLICCRCHLHLALVDSALSSYYPLTLHTGLALNRACQLLFSTS